MILCVSIALLSVSMLTQQRNTRRQHQTLARWAANVRATGLHAIVRVSSAMGPCTRYALLWDFVLKYVTRSLIPGKETLLWVTRTECTK